MPNTFLGYATLFIGLLSYSLYFRNIFRGKTKPEAYSWLIWSLLAGITFFAQASAGAGPGAWATALTAIFCLLISATSFYLGDGPLRKIDILSLLGAFLGLGAWKYTNNPLYAVVFVVIIGAMGFVPTFRKAFHKPWEESVSTFALNSFKFLIAFFALDSLNLVTALYPVSLTLMNVALASVIWYRRSLSPRK